MPVVVDKEKEFKLRQKKKREKMVERKKKRELKRLRKRLKIARGGEKKNIEEAIHRIETRKKKVEEDNFEIIVNTLANKRKAQQREVQRKKEEEQVRQELVKRGQLEDKIYMNTRKHRVDDDELQDFCLSKEFI